MKTLRLANFGMQGMVGEALTPEIVIDFAAAFGTFLNRETVLVGRDTRQSSRMLRSAVIAGLTSTGCRVLDFGVCPTPMLQFSAERYSAAGAVSISGGHNPMGWNAVQLISSTGAFIEPVGGDTVLDIYHGRDFERAAWNTIGVVEEVNDFTGPYFDALLEFVDTDAIRSADFSAVIDPVNGAGCRFVEPFSKRLGVKTIPINHEESGYLAHEPEPRPRNARQVANLMNVVPSNIGFVASSDMGRLSIVSELGETASEEYTFSIIANHVLGKQSGVVVTNCCTTRTIDEVASRHGSVVVKTRVGQAYILSAMADEQGVLGGEGNGSVAMPEFSRAFDAFLMMGLILEAMATCGARASELVAALPRYHMVKRKVSGESHRCYQAIDRLSRNETWSGGGTPSTVDGLRVDWEDGWVHLRASHTEPVVRVISESKSKDEAENRADEATRLLEHVL
jgi:phosphoglucosamine mutase